ncbi:MAG: hypothetical protein KBD37_08515 [Burkholderiales bacterium]|nr:hypothetical protein [Burkholderiales bacterium]
MNDTTLVNFIKSFDGLVDKYSGNEYAVKFNSDMHFSLCNLLNTMGHSTLDKETFDDWLKDHMSSTYNGGTKDEQLLSFILNLTHVGADKENMAKYSLACCDLNLIYDVLSRQSKISFKNPQQESDTTFVYDKNDVLPVLLEHKILIEKQL